MHTMVWGTRLQVKGRLRSESEREPKAQEPSDGKSVSQQETGTGEEYPSVPEREPKAQEPSDG